MEKSDIGDFIKINDNNAQGVDFSKTKYVETSLKGQKERLRALTKEKEEKENEIRIA